VDDDAVLIYALFRWRCAEEKGVERGVLKAGTGSSSARQLALHSRAPHLDQVLETLADPAHALEIPVLEQVKCRKPELVGQLERNGIVHSACEREKESTGAVGVRKARRADHAAVTALGIAFVRGKRPRKSKSGDEVVEGAQERNV